MPVVYLQQLIFTFDLHQLNKKYLCYIYTFRNNYRKQTMNKLLLATAVLSLGLASTNSLAGDAAAGQAKAGICAGCHGVDGISPNTMWPNLAGQQEGYLAKQIKNFRDGVRKDAMMAPMVAGLTDDDIANLAAFYASKK